MTTTLLQPLPKSTPEQDELFDHLYEYGVSAEGVHSRLEKVCQAYATQARADLEVENQRLREALEFISTTDPIDAALDPQRAVRVARAALEKQP